MSEDKSEVQKVVEGQLVVRPEMTVNTMDWVAIAVVRHEKAVEEEIEKVTAAFDQLGKEITQNKRQIAELALSEMQAHVQPRIEGLVAAWGELASENHIKATLQTPSVRVQEQDNVPGTWVTAVVHVEQHGYQVTQMQPRVKASAELVQLVADLKAREARVQALSNLRFELFKKLKDLPKIERRARAALAERALEESSTGRSILDTINNVVGINDIPRLQG